MVRPLVDHSSRPISVRKTVIAKLTNRQLFSMVSYLSDHRNDVNMFKTQVDPRTAGE